MAALTARQAPPFARVVHTETRPAGRVARVRRGGARVVLGETCVASAATLGTAGPLGMASATARDGVKSPYGQGFRVPRVARPHGVKIHGQRRRRGRWSSGLR